MNPSRFSKKLLAMITTALFALAPHAHALDLTSFSVTQSPKSDEFTIKGRLSNASALNGRSIAIEIGGRPFNLPASSLKKKKGALTFRSPRSKTGISLFNLNLSSGNFTLQGGFPRLLTEANPLSLRIGPNGAEECALVSTRLKKKRAPKSSKKPKKPASVLTRTLASDLACPGVSPLGLTVRPVNLIAGESELVSIQAEGADQQGLAALSQLEIRRIAASGATTPICVLSDNGDGSRGCSVPLFESTPGEINLVVTRSDGSIVSQGTRVRVVAPMSAADYAQALDSETKAGELVSALRAAAEVLPASGATLQKIAKLPGVFGVEIDRSEAVTVEFTSGLVSQFIPPITDRPGTFQEEGAPAKSAATVPNCGGPESGDDRVAIENTKRVVVWDPGFFADSRNETRIAEEHYKFSRCPVFPEGLELFLGPNASPASLAKLSGAGTVFIVTHGATYQGQTSLATGQDAPATLPNVDQLKEMQRRLISRITLNDATGREVRKIAVWPDLIRSTVKLDKALVYIGGCSGFDNVSLFHAFGGFRNYFLAYKGKLFAEHALRALPEFLSHFLGAGQKSDKAFERTRSRNYFFFTPGTFEQSSTVLIGVGEGKLSYLGRSKALKENIQVFRSERKGIGFTIEKADSQCTLAYRGRTEGNFGKLEAVTPGGNFFGTGDEVVSEVGIVYFANQDKRGNDRIAVDISIDNATDSMIGRICTTAQVTVNCPESERPTCPRGSSPFCQATDPIFDDEGRFIGNLAEWVCASTGG